jgi:hypothetical protein
MLVMHAQNLGIFPNVQLAHIYANDKQALPQIQDHLTV